MIKSAMALVALCFIAMLTTAFGAAGRTQPAVAAQPRFDELVRTDFFAGVAGDVAALDRAMRFIEETLAKDSSRADALVWHGAGLVTRAGQAFEKGDTTTGAALWQLGLREMNDAVAREPENVAVLIPRGAVLLEVSRALPEPEEAKVLLATGVGDYEKVLELQAPYFRYLSEHSRGELLYGRAEGLHRLGERARARMYFERLLAEAKDSEYGRMADAWLKDPSASMIRRSGCVGCHKN
jgi:hypothetical protein